MHYIRFLKPPRLVTSSRAQTLSAKITITTDLGESFLCADVSLIVELQCSDQSCVQVGNGTEFLWKGKEGMRSLEVSVRTSTRKSGCTSPNLRMLVRPKEEKYAMVVFDAIVDEKNIRYPEDAGGIVAVWSMDIDTKTTPDNQNNGTARMAERFFTTIRKDIRICEETGESIARHIWYS